MLTNVAIGAEASATMAWNGKAKRLVGQGVDVAAFTVGEPDFDTPDNIKQAAHLAIQSGFTKYTASAGTPALRQAIAGKLRRDNHVSYAPEEILVSNGAKHALLQIMLCLVQDGDQVLLPAPYWVSYAAQAHICGAEPVLIDCTRADGMKLTPELLEGAITERSRALVLNSPCNPTGAVLARDEIRRLVDVALAHDLWIISDETYENFIYDGAEHVSPASLSDEARRRVITVNSLSKSYAMTGWRIGYAAGPAEVIGAAGRLQSNMTSGPNSIAQKAGVEALNGPQQSVEEMGRAFDQRRRLLVEGLNRLPGVSCPMPQGAFFAFPDVRGLFGRTYGSMRVEDSHQLCAALLELVQVVAIPGSAFGTEGYLRFSYATSIETIEKGLARLAAFIEMGQD